MQKLLLWFAITHYLDFTNGPLIYTVDLIYVESVLKPFIKITTQSVKYKNLDKQIYIVHLLSESQMFQMRTI